MYVLFCADFRWIVHITCISSVVPFINSNINFETKFDLFCYPYHFAYDDSTVIFPQPGPRFLCIPVLLRLVLIPAFLFCHYYPKGEDRILPVLIDSDWAYWVLSMILGITSGYYSSLAMMYCPR